MTGKLAKKAGIDAGLLLMVRETPVAAALFDRDMRYLAWSGEWSRLYGLGTRDLGGMRHYDLFPDLPERWRNAHARGLQGETVSNRRDSYRLADGRQVWVNWSVLPIRLGDGTVAGIVLFTEDITEGVLAEDEARLSNERLKAVTTALGIGLFEHDFETGETTISDGFLALLQISRADVPQTTEGWIALLRPPDLAVYLADRLRALDPRGDGRFTSAANPLVNGHLRHMQVRSRVLFEGEGAARRPRRLIGVLSDRTDEQQVQDALSRAQRLETVGRLAGMVAHDFNNILTVILASLELIELRRPDPEVRQLLAQASEAAQMGAAFNKRLLALAGTGGRQGTAVPLAVDAHLSQAWEIFRRVLSDEIVLHFEPRSAGAVVAIDPAELDGALLNLVVNARDAQPEGGAIELRSQRVTLDAAGARAYRGGRAGDFLRLSVRDQGGGMAEDVASRAGEPFFSTKGGGRGTGLGLTSVAMTAERSGGFLHIVTAPGKGTEVMLFLPLAPPAAAASTAFAPRESLPFGNGELILVVEDDALVRETVLQRLEAIGYAVLEAGNAQAALGLIEAGEPVDLVFSDVVMPGAMSGYDLARRLQEDHPDIAVLLTSGHVSQAYRSHADAAPDVALLPKPYLLRDLAVAVAEALSPPSLPSA